MRQVRSDEGFVCPCIVCGVSLERIFPEHPMGSINEPNHAISFFGSGQYGSTIFDSFDGNTLEINVCDECVKKAAEKGWVIYNNNNPHKDLPIGKGSFIWNGKDFS